MKGLKEAVNKLKFELENRESIFKKAYFKLNGEKLKEEDFNKKHIENLMDLCEYYHQIRIKPTKHDTL